MNYQTLFGIFKYKQDLRKYHLLKIFGGMHLSLFSPSGGAAGYPWEIRQFKKKMVSNSPPLGKYLVSKIPWMGPSYLLYSLI